MIKLRSLFLTESFNNVSDLLSNPQHNEKTIGELLDEFKNQGGEILGKGKFATGLTHPTWKYVVKIFSNDVPYLKFVRFCLKHPKKSFPVFYDKPRRIIPNYKRHKSNTYLYVVKTEKLSPINIREYDDMQYYTYYNKDDAKEMADKGVGEWEFIYKKLLKLETEKPSFPQFKEDYDFLLNHSTEIGVPDIHSKNVMKRNDGSLVLADPFWVGETPYQTHDRLLKIELDYDNYDNSDDTMIKGGEKFKKTKHTKFNSIQPDNSPSDEDVPF